MQHVLGAGGWGVRRAGGGLALNQLRADRRLGKQTAASQIKHIGRHFDADCRRRHRRRRRHHCHSKEREGKKDSRLEIATGH